MSRFGRLTSGGASIDNGQRHGVACRLLQCLCLFDVSPASAPRRRSQNLASRMDLSVRATLRFIVACSVSTFWTRWLRVTVMYDSSGLLLSSCCQSEHGSEIVDDGFTNVCSKPAWGLLGDRSPQRQVLRHHAPSIEDVPPVVLTLGSVFVPYGQARGEIHASSVRAPGSAFLFVPAVSQSIRATLLTIPGISGVGIVLLDRWEKRGRT